LFPRLGVSQTDRTKTQTTDGGENGKNELSMGLSHPVKPVIISGEMKGGLLENLIPPTKKRPQGKSWYSGGGDQERIHK